MSHIRADYASTCDTSDNARQELMRFTYQKYIAPFFMVIGPYRQFAGKRKHDRLNANPYGAIETVLFEYGTLNIK